MTLRLLFPALLASLLAAGCGDAHDHDDATGGEGAHDEVGPHDGDLIEVGDEVAHLEVLHEDDTGVLTVYVLGADAKTPLALEKPLVLKIAAEEGPQELPGEPLAGETPTNSAFRWSSPALKGEETRARFALEIGGTTYSPDLAHDH